MTDKHYSIRELADKYNLNYRTIWNWIKTNQVKAIKVKGVLRIKDSEFRKLISNE